MGWRGTLVWAALAALAALGGCSGAGQGAAARQAPEGERRLEQRLDQLEQRLLADRARVRLWRELRDRHDHVSGIACANLAQHARASGLLEEQQRAKRELAKKGRVALNLPRSARTRQ